MLLHHVPAADIVRPVRAFHQHIGQKLGDQFRRFVFVEDDHVIDALQRRQHFGPVRLRVDGPPVSLVTADRRIRIQTNDQSVALLPRELEIGHVAGVKDVERAVRENDRSPLLLQQAPNGPHPGPRNDL